MIRWAFRQKMRFEKGLGIMPAVNFLLLTISASDRIQRALPWISTTKLVCLLFPAVVLAIWLVGFALTLPGMQDAEDQAMKDTFAWRRAIGGRYDPDFGR